MEFNDAAIYNLKYLRFLKCRLEPITTPTYVIEKFELSQSQDSLEVEKHFEENFLTILD